MTERYIQLIEDSIKNAEKGISALHSDILTISGASSPKVRHLLNNINRYFSDQTYLEIGCFTGSTFVSS